MNSYWSRANGNGLLVMRFAPGTDLLEGLEEAVREAGLKAGAVISCIGSLRRSAFHIAVPAQNPVGASYSDPIHVEGPLELLAGQGTIGLEEDGSPFVHLHAVFSDGEGTLRGGHLVRGGNPVLVTCEVAIAVLAGVSILRKFDPQVAMKIFSVQKEEGLFTKKG